MGGMDMASEHLSKEEQVILAQGAAEGDKGAWWELHKHFNEALIGYIASWVGDPEEAKELAQETWIYAWEKISTYDPQYCFYTFLRNLANFIVKRYFEKRKRWKDLHILFSEFPDLRTIGDEGGDSPGQEPIPPLPPFPSPDPDDAILLRELLSITFQCCAKPHQLIVFGFKLLEWKPREIVEKLSDERLKELSLELVKDYCSSFHSYEKEIAPCFSPLLEKMERYVREVYTEPEYPEKLRDIMEQKVGSTRLRVYHGDNPEAFISDWADKVRKRTKNAIEEGILCG